MYVLISTTNSLYSNIYLVQRIEIYAILLENYYFCWIFIINHNNNNIIMTLVIVIHSGNIKLGIFMPSFLLRKYFILFLNTNYKKNIKINYTYTFNRFINILITF